MAPVASALRTIQRYGLLPPGTRVLVAVSGGGDSVALLLVLRELSAAAGFEIAGMAHLNHALRGADADADEAFCRALAADLGLPVDVERVDVAAAARAAGRSLEHEAHLARRAFYRRAAARIGADRVAVGHTRDDQAETFLLRVVRGAGPKGLGGMHPRSGLVVRPFIETPRGELRAWLAARQQPFRDDASNRDVAIPRNRVREELLPFLAARFNPAIVDTLDREARIGRDDAALLDGLAAEAARRLVVPTADGADIGIEDLLREPVAIQRRVVRLAQQSICGGRFVGFEAVEAVLRLAVSNASRALDLPGHRANRRGGVLVLTTREGRAAGRPPDFAYRLAIPGAVAVPEAACTISADTRSVPPGRRAGDVWRLAVRADEACVEARLVSGPLCVRRRQAGDRLRPLGLAGSKKLQDVFVDAKIDRRQRDRTPIIAAADGRIVWVPGVTLAEEFRVTDATRDVVILKRVPV